MPEGTQGTAGLGGHAVDRFLPLAVAAFTAFHRFGDGGKQRVGQAGQLFVQCLFCVMQPVPLRALSRNARTVQKSLFILGHTALSALSTGPSLSLDLLYLLF